MTRLLFLPDEETLLMLESPLPADELTLAVQSGRWQPPEAFTGGRQLALRAIRQGPLVLVFPVGAQADETVAPSGEIHLSRRQKEVLQALAEGQTTRQIAVRLKVMPHTVKYHVAMLKKSLHAETRAQLVARGAALGLCRSSSNFQTPANQAARQYW